MDQFKLYLQYQKEVAQARLKVIERFQQQGTHQVVKRTSNMNIVQNILNTAGHPLHVSDIIEMALKKYQVQLNRDSLVSAILKKINAGQIFIRTAPNTFALRTYTVKEEP
ncbi:MAG: hypothetical protein FP814_06745 [Desulfobacterium sp.]|nr:hypothetical protein [Desulfobacterium sp.]MBU4010547.1 winged helix-turn-helix domain-containing protein [Pseudomonadota bacterium]MBU4037391.1 winged helix-turn-helix domain-containing protein [Pseudomonadota bacterium]